MRTVLFIVLPLLLPTLIYFAYMSAQQRRRATGAIQPAEVPWSWLAAAGVILFAASLLAFTLLDRGSGHGVYHPARVVDGKIVPGYFEDDAGGAPD